MHKTNKLTCIECGVKEIFLFMIVQFVGLERSKFCKSELQNSELK